MIRRKGKFKPKSGKVNQEQLKITHKFTTEKNQEQLETELKLVEEVKPTVANQNTEIIEDHEYINKQTPVVVRYGFL